MSNITDDLTADMSRLELVRAVHAAYPSLSAATVLTMSNTTLRALLRDRNYDPRAYADMSRQELLNTAAKRFAAALTGRDYVAKLLACTNDTLRNALTYDDPKLLVPPSTFHEEW